MKPPGKTDSELIDLRDLLPPSPSPLHDHPPETEHTDPGTAPHVSGLARTSSITLEGTVPHQVASKTCDAGLARDLPSIP